MTDPFLFGWDDTSGIVSVWASREGLAFVWRRETSPLGRREGERTVCERQRFRPWLFATRLDDLGGVQSDPHPNPLPGGEGIGESGEGVPPPLPMGDTCPGGQRQGRRGEGPRFSYRELDGPPDSFRYLISATDGRALERELRAGASRRLGREVENLADLPDYYRVAPVEQYLMQTGRVYFRGLVYADLHRLQFDLETTALDPQRGRIFLVAVRDNRSLATTLTAASPADEARLIADLCALIRERDPDVIENHNLFGFDLPFLAGRAAALGVPLALGRAPAPSSLESYTEPGRYPGAPRSRRFSVAGRELIDTLDAVRRHDFVARDLPSHRLKDVARHFGVAAPDRVYLAGADVYATFRQSPDLARRYALDDVAEVDALSQRLMGATFALTGMAPRRYERLASAGPAMGILEPMLVRAYLHAAEALPGPEAARASGHQHMGGAAYLLGIGVAERVVKADMASLYPSIMRAFRIGPVGDRLDVLLHIVDRMTRLRLEHKAAARAASPGSLEAGYHQAMQAAMKLLVNSAYGYMGAGSMALFADAHAADEVTRRGRELLDQTVAGLREQGVALIEADTDGVYFAVPPDWTEAHERAAVAQVGVALPEGIQLEYEGRYQAMFSHEIKNYALLTYDGQLIVRGAALRSSRSEPFGARFLLTALRCLLQRDVVGVHRAFVDTLAALRSRALPAGDVATRVRLSKSSETYAATRAKQREAQYEALLAAGRTMWSQGERVRYYKAADGTYVWLPDESDEPGVGGEGAAEEEDAAGSEADQSLDGAGRGKDGRAALEDRRDYDVEHYTQVLLTSYAGRLRKAFDPDDFAQLFRPDGQVGLFDRPVESIRPIMIPFGTTDEHG